MTASIALSYYAFMADLAVLIPPLVATLNICASGTIVRRRPFLVSACLLTLLAPACLWFFPLQFYVVFFPVLALLIAVVMSEPEHQSEQVAADV